MKVQKAVDLLKEMYFNCVRSPRAGEYDDPKRKDKAKALKMGISALNLQSDIYKMTKFGEEDDD